MRQSSCGQLPKGAERKMGITSKPGPPIADASDTWHGLGPFHCFRDTDGALQPQSDSIATKQPLRDPTEIHDIFDLESLVLTDGSPEEVSMVEFTTREENPVVPPRPTNTRGWPCSSG